MRKLPDTYPWLPFVPVLVALGYLVGCDTHVEPFKESDRHFSIFGNLDAGVDTQFVRVSPIRETIHPVEIPLEATVTVEQLSTGEVTTWQDSLFYFTWGPQVVSRPHAYNFWSSTNLEPGESYRFRVEGPDGGMSTATVALPDSFPSPDVRIRRLPNEGVVVDVTITGVDRLADVMGIYHIWNDLTGTLEVLRFSHLDRVRENAAGYAVRLALGRDYERIHNIMIGGEDDYWIVRREVYVAAAGPDWPADVLDGELLELPDVVTNVENGVGFLGGLMSHTIPWELPP